MKPFLTLISIMSLLMGLYLLFHPLATLSSISWLLAAYLFAIGLSRIISYVNTVKAYRQLNTLIQASAFLIFSFLLFFSGPAGRASFIVTMIAYLLLSIALLTLVSRYQYRKTLLDPTAICLFLIGAFFLYRPLLIASFLGNILAFLLIMGGIAGLIFLSSQTN